MPVARIQGEDGRIIRVEVPEGASMEEIDAFVNSNDFNAQVSTFFVQQTQPQEQLKAQTPTQPEQGFSALETIAQGGQKTRSVVDKALTGDPMSVARVIPSVLATQARTVGTALDPYNYYPESTKKLINEGFGTISSGISSTVGKLPLGQGDGANLNDLAASLTGQYSGVKKVYPESVGLAEDVATIAGLGKTGIARAGATVGEKAAIGAAKVAASPVTTPVKTAGNIARGTVARTGDQLQTVAAKAKKNASNTFTKARVNGGDIGNPSLQGAISNIEGGLPKLIGNTNLNPENYPVTNKILKELNKKASDGGGLTLADYDNLRQRLDDAVGGDGAVAKVFKEELEDKMKKIPEFQTLETGKKQSQNEKVLQRLTDIKNKSGGNQQKLISGVENYLNGKQAKYLNDKQKKVLRNFTKKTITGSILREVSKVGNPITASVIGHPFGAGVGTAITGGLIAGGASIKGLRGLAIKGAFEKAFTKIEKQGDKIKEPKAKKPPLEKKQEKQRTAPVVSTDQPKLGAIGHALLDAKKMKTRKK